MKNILFVAVLFVSTTIMAQKAKVTKGDWSALKGISVYNLEFDYSNLEIPKYDSEEEFLKDKMAKREEKEVGGGEKFKNSWFGDREDRYEPKFIESFNKRWKNNEVSVGKNMGAEYTLKIHTTFLYPGYNVGVMRQNAKLEATISLVKSDNPDTVLFSVNYTKVEGYGAMGSDYNSGYRISEAYAKLGKEFAANIRKKAK
ncbi:hypothetical protein [Corallibacter sp.]|uniref:hypothetical protein n=1 Tax=Corallibacter sp. TaxID=2038084 RepID=UPI003A8D8588